ncbi:hypothetical protein MHB50_17400 [Siminovitchia sp. FSL H7-0308]|uniref:hypothetical protein n=1 Tax=unclassified Siminovitchia TaxID=2837530 RepID=UPI0030D4B1AA
MPVPRVASRVRVDVITLAKELVLVFGDQRGAGKSYHQSIPPESIRVAKGFNKHSLYISLSDEE